MRRLLCVLLWLSGPISPALAGVGDQLEQAVAELAVDQVLVGWRPFVIDRGKSKTGAKYALSTAGLGGEQGHLVVAAGKWVGQPHHFLSFNTLGKHSGRDVVNTFLGGVLESGCVLSMQDSLNSEQAIFNDIEAEAAAHGTPVSWRIYRVGDCGCTRAEPTGAEIVGKIRAEIIALNRGFVRDFRGEYRYTDAEARRIRNSYGYCVTGSKNGKNHNCATVFLHLLAHVSGGHRCHELDRFQGDQLGFAIGTAICAAGVAVMNAPLAAQAATDEDEDEEDRCSEDGDAAEMAPACWLIGGTLLGLGALINVGTAVLDLTFGCHELSPRKVFRRELSTEFGWDSHKLGCYLNPQCWQLVEEVPAPVVGSSYNKSA
ncbi:MAG: hypothetical protein OXT67_10560 [Zetaproteobacteria bacterium]|nr:hypothetical protein [Zetaproteobacteria bacterium]